MKILYTPLLVITGMIIASCSEKPAPAENRDAATPGAPRETARASEIKTSGRGGEVPPSERRISEDCVALLRSTRAVSTQANPDCPGCPVGGTEVLTVRQLKTDTVSCTGDTCTVLVTIRAAFNPGSGEKMAGGLTAWIPPEQREAWLRGETPAGEQTYRVQITYRFRDDAWTAVEFDRVPAG